MSGFFEAIEASGLSVHLRGSRWTYPLVNAGHVAGIALLVGAVLPMDLRVLGLVNGPDPRRIVRFLRPFAIAGAALAVACGLTLFAAQATDYVQSPWFQAKMALLSAAVLNALWHLRAHPLPRRAALLSLVLWPGVLFCGRMIGYG